jgi:ABC-type transport system involved in multi-copper enzyme maturation permease subunit
LNYVFQFYYGIAVLLSIRQKLQWKALYESVILSLGIVILFCKHVQFTGGNDASYQEMYGPDFVNAKTGSNEFV